MDDLNDLLSDLISKAPAVAAAIITALIALIVLFVTRQVQIRIARENRKTQIEIAENSARIAVARERRDWDISRLDAVLEPLIAAADAANRYVVATFDIDVTEWESRREYVLAILDPHGRAKAELKATPNFSEKHLVQEALAMLEEVAKHPETGKAVRKAWDNDLLGRAIHALSKARNDRMDEYVSEIKAPILKSPESPSRRQKKRNRELE